MRAPAVPFPRQRPAFLDILSIRAFRYLWLSNGLTFMGARVQELAVAWLVLEMTDSKLWVGVGNGAPTLPVIFFSLLGGVLADQTDRRVMMIWSRLTLAVLTFLAAFLVTTGSIELWQLMVIVVLAVGVMALDLPAASTLVFDVVGKGRLLSANAMSSIVVNLGTILGPTAAGVLIANAGVGTALYLLSAAYLVSFAALFMIKRSECAESRKHGRILQDLAQGFSYIRRTPRVAWLVSLGATLPLAGIFMSMVPIYARDVLQIGPEGMGVLMATYGVGSLIGSVSLSVPGPDRRSRRDARPGDERIRDGTAHDGLRLAARRSPRDRLRQPQHLGHRRRAHGRAEPDRLPEVQRRVVHGLKTRPTVAATYRSKTGLLGNSRSPIP